MILKIKGDLDFNVKNFKPTRYTINGLTYVRHLDDTSDFYVWFLI